MEVVARLNTDIAAIPPQNWPRFNGQGVIDLSDPASKVSLSLEQ
jgi:hypothetical protein